MRRASRIRQSAHGEAVSKSLAVRCFEVLMHSQEVLTSAFLDMPAAASSKGIREALSAQESGLGHCLARPCGSTGGQYRVLPRLWKDASHVKCVPQLQKGSFQRSQ